jgi:hypothetical protein
MAKDKKKKKKKKSKDNPESTAFSQMSIKTKSKKSKPSTPGVPLGQSVDRSKDRLFLGTDYKEVLIPERRYRNGVNYR